MPIVQKNIMRSCADNPLFTALACITRKLNSRFLCLSVLRFVGESLRELGVPVQLEFTLGNCLSVTYAATETDRSTAVVGKHLSDCLKLYLASLRRHFTGFNLLQKCSNNLYASCLSQLECLTKELADSLDRLEYNGERHQTLSI